MSTPDLSAVSRSLVVLALVGATSLAALAQSDEDTPAPPAPEEEQAQDQKTPPSLDDLLGIPDHERPARPENGDDDTVQALDLTERELERELTQERVSELFKQAVQEMGDAADLIEAARDVGVRTQRLQEDIVRKLETLIEQAENAAQQSQSSSSRGSQQQQQQQQQSPAQPRAQQQSQSQTQGDNREERLPPGAQSGPLADVLDAASNAWGSLPERVRDSLLQGLTERLSDQYRSLTEAYYRRLAEEGNQ